MTHDASIVKSNGGSVAVPQVRNPLDMGRFQFTETVVKLNKTGAWTLDGQTAMAFGAGASQIGAMAGVSITKPLHVMVHGKEQDNPFLEDDAQGQPGVLWIRKIGVYLDKHGLIRYVDLTDRIDISAYLAERATKLMTQNDEGGKSVVGNSGRFCTKDQADAWNKSGKEPGKDVWWYIPTQGNIGVAFNLADRVYKVNKLMEEIIHFRKAVMRRFETATDRRVISSIVPEFLKTTDFEAEYNQKYKQWTVTEARFHIDSPEGHGFELGIFQQIARALKEDNPEMRERALAAFNKMSGFEEVPVKEMPIDGVPDPITMTPEWEKGDETKPVPDEAKTASTEKPADSGTATVAEKVDPFPAGQVPIADFREYVKAQTPRLTVEQAKTLREIVGPDLEFHQFKGQEVAKAVRKFFVDIAGRVASTEPETGEITADMKRKYIGEQLAEDNKKLVAVMFARYGEEWTLDSLSDIEIEEVYKDLTK